jgi:hypothetical protein
MNRPSSNFRRRTVLAIIGVALGAALVAALPTSRDDFVATAFPVAQAGFARHTTTG